MFLLMLIIADLVKSSAEKASDKVQQLIEKNKVLEKELDRIDLDIGFKEFEIDKSPEEVRDLLPELQQDLKQAG